MRRGEPNLPVKRTEERFDKIWESITSKCHPAIFELGQLWKENPSSERMEKRLREIHRKYSGPIPPAPNTFATQIIFRNETLASRDDGLGIAEALHFERHRSPLKVDLRKILARDFKASKRILRTLNELEQLRCGKGPIPPFKSNLEHSGIFEALWGFGIEKLTSEELATFFDQYCRCGSDAHDPDALKKHRARFQTTLIAAIMRS